MKRFAVILLFAVFCTLSGAETEVGFPKDFKEWRYLGVYVEGSVCLTEKLGLPCVMLQGDFPRQQVKHGESVLLARSFPGVKGKFKGAKVKLFAPGFASLIVRFVDGTGQTFQYHYKLADADAWQTVFCSPKTHDREWIVSSWGGANDKVWHEPLRGMQILMDSVLKCYFRPIRTPKLYLNSVKLITE